MSHRVVKLLGADQVLDSLQPGLFFVASQPGPQLPTGRFSPLADFEIRIVQGIRDRWLTIGIPDQTNPKCSRATRFDIASRQQSFQMPWGIVPLNLMSNVVGNRL